MHSDVCLVVEGSCPNRPKNQVIQAREATIDVEVSNVRSLIEELKELHSQWSMILNTSKLVANSLNILAEFPKNCKSRRDVEEGGDEADELESRGARAFKRYVFHTIVDSVILGLTTHFDAANRIYQKFSFLWEYSFCLKRKFCRPVASLPVNMKWIFALMD